MKRPVITALVLLAVLDAPGEAQRIADRVAAIEVPAIVADRSTPVELLQHLRLHVRDVSLVTKGEPFKNAPRIVLSEATTLRPDATPIASRGDPAGPGTMRLPSIRASATTR